MATLSRCIELWWASGRLQTCLPSISPKAKHWHHALSKTGKADGHQMIDFATQIWLIRWQALTQLRGCIEVELLARCTRQVDEGFQVCDHLPDTAELLRPSDRAEIAGNTSLQGG